MKQNKTPSILAADPAMLKMFHTLANGLSACERQFSQESAPAGDERLTQLAFSNGLYLALGRSDGAAGLLEAVAGAGIAPEPEAVRTAFSDFTVDDVWIAETGARERDLWRRANGGNDAPAPLMPRVMFATAAGIQVIRDHAVIREVVEAAWPKLNSESQFLASRLLAWGTLPKAEVGYGPFAEYTASFYPPNSVERGVIASAVNRVIDVAQAFADPWSLEVWAEAGWFAGRRDGDSPIMLRALLNEVPDNALPDYLNLYRDCILGTTSAGGQIRPMRAVQRYFADTGDDGFARTYCRGDQPRFVARAAYDFTYWMGLLSTQPIPLAR